MAWAALTAASPMARRSSGLRPGAGASSTTFWWRRWIEQSRSLRYRQLPWLSANTWISTWRGLSTYFSTSMRESPNEDCASRCAEASASASSLSRSTTFMPLPPPPAVALSSTG
ncbi:hypothetical protein D3C84_405560 [compost metagenome]